MKSTVLVLASVSLWFTATARTDIPAFQPDDACPHPGGAPAFVQGHVRFQVLAPGLVRMEYSPSGAFVDARSVSMINRNDWPQTAADGQEEAGVQGFIGGPQS